MSARQASQFKGADNSGWLALDVTGFDILRNPISWAAYIYDTEEEAIKASPLGKAIHTS